MAIRRLDDLFSGGGREERFQFVFQRGDRLPSGDYSGKPVVVPVDATESETYSLGASITDHEIQSGAVLSDHIHLLPQRVEIRAIVSEAPLFAVGALSRAGAQAAFSAGTNIVSGATEGNFFGNVSKPVIGAVNKYAPTQLTGKIAADVLGYQNRPQAQQDFWRNWLKKQRAEKTPFKIVSGLDAVEHVFFESITFERKPSEGASLVFSATLKEIRYVSDKRTATGRAAELQPSIPRLRAGEIAQTAEQVADKLGVSGLLEGHKLFVKDAVKYAPDRAAQKVVDTIKSDLRSFLPF